MYSQEKIGFNCLRKVSLKKIVSVKNIPISEQLIKTSLIQTVTHSDYS